jgi:TolB-like protein/tetratricopeptide (TPR) repeat protein
VVAIGLAVLALLSCLYVVVRSMDGIGAAPSAAPISIVVLPFDDISPARDQADLAAGVARTIRDTLSLLPDLAVQEEISSAAVKGDDARTIGRTLNVAYALFGEMYKQGERLRINVRLVRTDNGQLEWPGSDERPFTDILKVQHEIATGVAQALQIKLGVGIGQQQGMTRNVAAYQAYTAAAPLLDGIPEHISKAIDALVRATKEDPTFARAWLGLARARAMMRGAAATPQERQYWSDRADEALDIARDMDADLPEVHQALAARSLYNGDWEEAARQHEKAAAARSSQTGRRVPIVLGSRFLLAVGRIKEAIQGLEERRALDRLNPGLANDLAGAYAADGNMDAAFKEWERASELEGMQAVVRSSALMGALSTGDPARIEHWIQAVSEESEGGPDKAVLYRSWLDLKSEALPKLHEFIEDPESFDASRGVAIAFMAHLGYNEAALQVVRSSANRGAVGGLWHPVYREMRKLNGFKQLLLDWRLVDYWRETDNWGEFCRFTTGDDFECH